MSNHEDKKEMSLTAADLKQILADIGQQNAENLKTILAESKKPSVLEQLQLDREAQEVLSKNQDRKDNAAGMLQKLANKRAEQRVCSHKHPKGDSHCVFVHERFYPVLQNTPGYLLCQMCNGKIRPGMEPEGYTGDDIYDNGTGLFNRIFQELPSQELFN